MNRHGSPPAVSIVIPVYNGSDYLGQAIDSALEQTYPNVEVLVVNDGSDDNGRTRETALAYGDRIRYFEKPNGGVASALNLGIREMRGDFFSWLSHDDFYLPRKVAHQIRLIERCGDQKQLVAGGYYIVNENRKPIGLMDFYSLYPRDRLEAPLFPVFHCAVNGCTMMIHRSHFDRVGLFDEALLTTQDYELWFRMLRGQRLLYTKSIDVVSRAYEGQTSRRMKTEHEEECTRLWMKMLQSLTRDERETIGKTEKLFFEDICDHFSRYTSYKHVAAYLKKCCTNESELFSWRKRHTWLEKKAVDMRLRLAAALLQDQCTGRIVLMADSLY